jgi:hypothetical protein
MKKSKIKISVTTKHFRESEHYSNPGKCPLAVAVKELYPNKNVGVHIGFVQIGGNHYEVTDDWCFSQEIYGGKLKGLSIDDMIAMAKNDESIEFPTKTLILQRV